MIVLDRFVAKPSKLAFDPAKGILMHMGYTEDKRYFSKPRTTEFALRDAQYRDLSLLGIGLVGRIVSLLLYILAWASFLTSSIAWGIRGDDQRHAVIVVLFVCFLGMTLAHAMIHLEPRQVAGVMWVPLLLGLEFLYRLLSILRVAFTRTGRSAPVSYRN
jgi:hypothetical protein